MEENDLKNNPLSEAESSEVSKEYVATESGSGSSSQPGKYIMHHHRVFNNHLTTVYLV